MADTIQELCLQAIKTQLDTLAAKGLKIQRGRPRPIGQNDLPVIVQLDGEDETDDTTTTQQHETSVDIEGYLTEADFSRLQTDASTLIGEVWQAVRGAKANPNVINVIHAGTPRERDDEEGVAPYLAFTMTIIVLFQTAKGDPFNTG